jgi:hypothetical protein
VCRAGVLAGEGGMGLNGSWLGLIIGALPAGPTAASARTIDFPLHSRSLSSDSHPRWSCRTGSSDLHLLSRWEVCRDYVGSVDDWA